MNFQRLKALSRKEFIHIIRDPRSLGMGIAMPVLLLIFFGYALSMDVKDISLIIWDQDNSPSSRSLISHFSRSVTFNIKGNVHNYIEIEEALNRREALAALVIPEDFALKLQVKNYSDIQFIVDGTDANTARISITYADQVVELFNSDLKNNNIRGMGRLYEKPLNLSIRVMYNPWLESAKNVIPGLIAVIMMIIAAMLTSLTIAREWETGTMEQLISTPIRPMELIIGKFIPYFIIGIVDVVIAVITARFLFNVPLKGDLVFLSVTSILFLTGALMMGITISIITKNQLLASQISIVATFLPAFLLSGFVYDIGNMPFVIRVVTYIVPARYFISILKSVFLKGGGLFQLWGDLIFLIGYAGVSIILARKSLHLKLD